MANVVREWTERGSGEKTGREGVSHDWPGKMCKGQAQQGKTEHDGQRQNLQMFIHIERKMFFIIS